MQYSVGLLGTGIEHMMQNNTGNILQIVQVVKISLVRHEYSLFNLKIGWQRLVLLS